MRLTRKIKDFMIQHKDIVAMYIFLSLSAPLFGIALPRYVGFLVDGFKKSKPVGDILVSIVVLALVIAAMRIGLDKMDTYFIPKLQGFVRKEIVISVMNQYSENYHDPEVGKLLTQIVILPSVIRDMFKQVKDVMLPISLVLIVGILYFAYLNKMLGAIAVFGYGMMGLTVYYFSKDSIKNSHKLAMAKEEFYEQVTDIFSNMLTIFSAGAEDYELSRFDNIQKEFNIYVRNATSSSNKFGYIFTVIYGLVFAFMAVAIYTLHKKKKITDGGIVSSFAILFFITKSLGAVIGNLRDFIYNYGVLHRANLTIIDIETGAILTQPLTGKITVTNLVVEKEEFKLEVPTLEIAAGERIVLTGQIGSGKSMLIKSLMKLTKCTGSIMYGAHNLADLNGLSVRKQIGFIPQQPRLFNRSIIDNILYGTNKTRQDAINLITPEMSLGNIDRIAGKNGDNLSGGQRQMVSLMRLILSDDPIIILDEPTAALDATTITTVLNLIGNLIANKTAIIISHDKVVIDYITTGGGTHIKMECIKLNPSGNPVCP